jgi:hypothetical protein
MFWPELRLVFGNDSDCSGSSDDDGSTVAPLASFVICSDGGRPGRDLPPASTHGLKAYGEYRLLAGPLT